MRADLTIIGVQLGWRSIRSAARPATCGLDIEVPLRRSKSRPLIDGETAATMSWPGAMTSGLRRSPPAPTSGPRDENDAVNGAGSEYVMVAALIVAVAPAVAA